VVGVTELRAAAMRYSSHGIPVFPIRPGTKKPLTRHGVYDATADPDQVWRYWRRWPMASIGVACGPESGWLVVDVDGPEGEASWAALEREHGPAPTLTSITARGRHLIYAYPPGCELGCSSGLLGPRLDSRGAGGYVLVPPSVHPSGQPYRWSSDMHPGPNGAQEPPSWLLDRLAEAQAPRKRRREGGGCVVGVLPDRLPRHLRAQAAESSGERRGRQTWRLVCACVEWGLSDSEVHALLAAHQPTVDKYGDGDRARDQVQAIIDKVRPDHRHEGHPCDSVSCRNAPRWMVAS
jgi:hypothetical protein